MDAFGPLDAVGDRHQVQLAELVADARIGPGFELVERVPVGRIRDPLEQVNRRQPARDDAMARREPHRPRGVADFHHPWFPAGVSDVIHARRRGIAARRRGRRPGRTTCARGPIGHRKVGAVLGLRIQWSAALRVRAAGSAATCRCRADRTGVRACRRGSRGSRSRRHLKKVEREAMPNNLSCSATVRPHASAMFTKARRPAPPSEMTSDLADLGLARCWRLSDS